MTDYTKKILKQFLELINDQFAYGGKKYASSAEKEATDCLFDDFGKNWLFGTMAKYCKRYKNLARERDLLKIACYCFITWLKRGFHLMTKGCHNTLNTTVKEKTQYYPKFVEYVTRYAEGYIPRLEPEDELDLEGIYNILQGMGDKEKFYEVTEEELFEIFIQCLLIWDRDIENKGGDKDTWNEKEKK